MSKLILIPTPIGNLSDITERATESIKTVDLLLCEDTRRSLKLLNHLTIKKQLQSYHKLNEHSIVEKITNNIQSGIKVGVISDAGTPSISDPGAVLINECLKQGIDVFPLPGPSAVTAAVSISGFNEKYLFYGFFPEKEKIIKMELEKLSTLNFCLVFFVSPKKINRIIPHLKNYFKDRKILICREISKYYEEYIRSNLEDLKTFKTQPKGELTIVLSEKQVNKKTSQVLSESDIKNIKTMINKLSTKEITEIIRQNSKVSKKEIYEYCLKLKNEK